jgi:RIO kinase 1
MAEPLALLLEDGIIDEVFTRLKSGKEADIYLVRHAGEVVAAKVYKERHVRSFKNNAAYKEGRQVRNTRTQRAMNKGSRFGQAASEEAWKAKESEALHKLHAAGVRVPKPVMFYEGVLLMETILDSDGRPAPRLIEAAIPREKVAEWYADLRSQVVKMLACDLVHGDLSPYNVLLAWNGPTVIDFPQVVGAAHNSQAERFFERDLETIRRFFVQHDPALNASAGDAREIWRAFVRRELTPDFVPTGKLPQERRPDRPQERHAERPPERRADRPHERRPERPHERHAEQPHARQPDRREPQGGRRPEPQRPLKAHAPAERREGRPHREPQPQGRPQQQQQGQPQRREGQRQDGRPQQRQNPQPQRTITPERRPGDPGRRGPAVPQVTVVQRLPGVGPAQPKRDAGERSGQGQGQGRGHGRPHGRSGKGHGHRGHGHKPR